MLDVIAFSLLCVMYVSENDTWSCGYCRRKEWMVSIWMTRSTWLLFVAVHRSVKLWTDYSIILWSLAYDITFCTSNHRIIRGWMKEDLLSLSTLVSWIIHWNGWGQFWMAIWLFVEVHNCDIVGRSLSILWAMLDYSIMLWSLVYNETFDTSNHWITRCWIIVFLICVQMYLE